MVYIRINNLKSNNLQSQVFLTIMTTVNQDHVLDSASSSISNILKVSRSTMICFLIES